MNDNLVSIITPAYNCEKYINHTIESVMHQTYENWEMIIINDYSTDRTKDLIEEYLAKDSRIKLINLKKNSGVVTARNKGLESATGRYIAFLDSDDLWIKDKLKKQISFMKNNNYSFSFSFYELIDSEGKMLNKIIKTPLSLDYKHAIKNTSIGCLTVCIDRKKTGEFRMPMLSHGEDHATWISLMKMGIIAYSIPEVLAYYRISDNSLTKNKFKSITKQWNNYREYYKFSIFRSTYYFITYIYHAIRKRIR